MNGNFEHGDKSFEKHLFKQDSFQKLNYHCQTNTIINKIKHKNFRKYLFKPKFPRKSTKTTKQTPKTIKKWTRYQNLTNKTHIKKHHTILIPRPNSYSIPYFQPLQQPKNNKKPPNVDSANYSRSKQHLKTRFYFLLFEKQTHVYFCDIYIFIHIFIVTQKFTFILD